MGSTGYVTFAEAAATLGVSVPRLRRVVDLGMVASDRVGSVRVLHEMQVEVLHDLPWPCSQAAMWSAEDAWAKIFDGDVVFEDVWRCWNRGHPRRLDASHGMRVGLLEAEGVVVGGAHAAAARGGLYEPGFDNLRIYHPSSATADLIDMGVERLSGDIVLWEVPGRLWAALDKAARPADVLVSGYRPIDVDHARYVPEHAAALDMAMSPQPRERKHGWRLIADPSLLVS